MQAYSAAHEKEENRYINSGIIRAIIAIVLCWLPLVSQILAISGYCREAVRLTARHRAKLAIGTIIAILALIISVGALAGEIYIYAQRPDIVEQVKTKAMQLLVMQSDESEDDDYGGLGLFDEDETYTDAEGEDEEDYYVPDEYYTDETGYYDDDGVYHEGIETDVDEEGYFDANGDYHFYEDEMYQDEDGYTDANGVYHFYDEEEEEDTEYEFDTAEEFENDLEVPSLSPASGSTSSRRFGNSLQ